VTHDHLDRAGNRKRSAGVLDLGFQCQQLSPRISSVELVQRMIVRIEALDQRVNAIVVRDFDRARETAKAADVALARAERRPLLGVPMTVKEAFNVAGLPTTWGIPRFKDYQPRTKSRLAGSK
jgi:Asp-tRNA(Asn)/Glu-tRNA(Gln) amidotransferase A subunit family amidase